MPDSRVAGKLSRCCSNLGILIGVELSAPETELPILLPVDRRHCIPPTLHVHFFRQPSTAKMNFWLSRMPITESHVCMVSILLLRQLAAR